MTAQMKNPPVTKEIFEQVAALLAANGATIDAEVMAYLQPLLDGEQDFAGHRAALEAMLAERNP